MVVVLVVVLVADVIVIVVVVSLAGVLGNDRSCSASSYSVCF